MSSLKYKYMIYFSLSLLHSINRLNLPLSSEAFASVEVAWLEVIEMVFDDKNLEKARKSFDTVSPSTMSCLN